MESTAPVWGAAESWAVGPSPDLDMGAEDGALEHQFHQIRHVIVFPDERILVANGGMSELRIYDRDGRHLRTFGGSGEGPAEFRELGGMTVVGDSLIVYDRRLGRASVFDLHGSHRRTFQFAPIENPSYPISAYDLAGSIGARRLFFRPFAFDAPTMPSPTVHWDSAANLVFDLAGGLVDTVGFSGMDMYGDPQVGTQLRLGGYSSVAVGGGRIVITRGRRYEIAAYDTAGSLRQVIRRLEDPQPVDEAMLQERLDWTLSMATTENMQRQMRARHLEDVARRRIAETLPTYTNLLLDATGHLWAQRYRRQWRQEPPRWEVFDDQGRWLGVVPVPDRFTIQHIGADYLLGVWLDELGVEHVRRYPLNRS